LVERPGEWAEVYSGTPGGAHQAANALRLRQYWVPPGAWDFTVRSFRRGHGSISRDSQPMAVIYARYLGTDEPAFRNLTEALNHSKNAVWDQHGRRLCPVCERRPLIKEPIGGYPSACDPCSWAMAVPGVPHGRVASYRHAGCRCPECRRANRENEHARKLQGGRPADAAPALAGTPSESSASSDPSGGFPVGNDGNAGAAIYEAHGLLSEWQAAVDARLRAEFPEEEGAA